MKCVGSRRVFVISKAGGEGSSSAVTGGKGFTAHLSRLDTSTFSYLNVSWKPIHSFRSNAAVSVSTCWPEAVTAAVRLRCVSVRQPPQNSDGKQPETGSRPTNTGVRNQRDMHSCAEALELYFKAVSQDEFWMMITKMCDRIKRQ